MEIIRVLLMRPGKVPLQILKNLLNIYMYRNNTVPRRKVYNLYNIVTYVFIIYSLMFMCFLGSVYLQRCKKNFLNPKCLSIKSLYLAF